MLTNAVTATAMRRRVVLGALAAVLLLPLGFTPGAAQTASLAADGETVRQQKGAVKRLRKTEKKLFKRRTRKAKELIKRRRDKLGLRVHF